MSSIGNTPFPGQDPRIDGSEAAKGHAAKNLTSLHTQFRTVRHKMMENREVSSEESQLVSTQTHIAALWSKASNRTEETIQGCYMSAIHQLRKAFK